MTSAKTKDELKKLGTAPNVKFYAGHGADENTFGVSCADIGKLAKNLRTNHDLAVELWASGNLDARTLATMIAGLLKMTASVADKWTKDLNCCNLALPWASKWGADRGMPMDLPIWDLLLYKARSS